MLGCDVGRRAFFSGLLKLVCLIFIFRRKPAKAVKGGQGGQGGSARSSIKSIHNRHLVLRQQDVACHHGAFAEAELVLP